jgi:hypothetical protein
MFTRSASCVRRRYLRRRPLRGFVPGRTHGRGIHGELRGVSRRRRERFRRCPPWPSHTGLLAPRHGSEPGMYFILKRLNAEGYLTHQDLRLATEAGRVGAAWRAAGCFTINIPLKPADASARPRSKRHVRTQGRTCFVISRWRQLLPSHRGGRQAGGSDSILLSPLVTECQKYFY